VWDLRNKVAVVTGASRGAGRGIAVSLGDCGAIVYVTGRSVRGRPTTDNIPGTIEDTAEEVTRRGGRGIPVQCDHTKDDEIESLFQRVDSEQGKLDVLVNSAGVRPTLLTARRGAPLMLKANQGLIVNITAWVGDVYMGNIFYDTAKSAINRMSFGMAQELKKHRITVVAVTPGFMRTERVVTAFKAAGVDGLEKFTESPEYVGRGVAALAADPNVLARTGELLTSAGLAQEYRFTDIDGRLVPPFKMPDDYPYK
jgi:NAD(P)-dependent dehydrogenase (short-subunit alcohol dehydrogenase family)